MNSNRIKADARAHMAENPGTSYQEALRAVTSVPEHPVRTPSAGSDDWVWVRTKILALIGQLAAKRQLLDIHNMHLVNQERLRRGMPALHGNTNFLVSGPPGSGKTTFARILTQTVFADGATSATSFNTVSRSTLVGTVEGETAAKTRAAYANSLGGVLVVDNAHELISDRNGAADPFGIELVTTLADLMRSDEAGTVVILCGYAEPLRQTLQSVEGFSTLFGVHLELTTFTPAEMWLIIARRAAESGLVVGPEAEDPIMEILTGLCEADRSGRPQMDTAGNAWFARNLVERAQMHAAFRLEGQDLAQLADEQLMELTVDDMVGSAREIIGELSR